MQRSLSMNNETATEEKDELCCDDTRALLEKYDRKEKNRKDDVFAMQTALCLLIITAFLALKAFSPTLFSELFHIVSELIRDEKEILPEITGKLSFL